MDVYLCSTVRNLLFALLRSLNEPQVDSAIVLVTDQQQIECKTFNLGVLPEHISLQFVSRKEVFSRLNSSFSGRLVRLMAVFNPMTNSVVRTHVSQRLVRLSPAFSLLNNIQDTRLFLFNDRNRLARLLRLAYAEYELIEDGLSNYSGTRLKPLESLWRFICRNRVEMRYLGDDRRCRSITLLNPEAAPMPLTAKLKSVDFVKNHMAVEICRQFFGVDLLENSSLPSCILATQPVSTGGLTASGFDLGVYRKLIDALQVKGLSLAIKVHPREQVDRYRQAFPELTMIESKVPLELLLFGAEKRVSVFSIYSSAGTGFEHFCRRLTLVRESEAESQQQLFAAWKKDPLLLDQRISELLVSFGE